MLNLKDCLSQRSKNVRSVIVKPNPLFDEYVAKNLLFDY